MLSVLTALFLKGAHYSENNMNIVVVRKKNASFNPKSKANSSCVILSMLLNLFEPQFLYLSRSSQSQCVK